MQSFEEYMLNEKKKATKKADKEEKTEKKAKNPNKFGTPEFWQWFKDNIKDFLEWDYIGAPWQKTKKVNLKHVGNGGLSLRTKQCMIDVILKDNKKIKNHPEDVYFSKSMIDMNIGNVADYDSASLFSTENVFNPNSFGGHQFWLDNKDWLKYISL